MSAESLRRVVRPRVLTEQAADDVVALAERHLLGKGAGFDWEPGMDPDAMPKPTQHGARDRDPETRG